MKPRDGLSEHHMLMHCTEYQIRSYGMIIISIQKYPVHYKNDKGNETAIRYIKDKLIGIDSVLITFLSLKEVFIRKPLTYDSVQTFDYIQDYKNSPVCFTMDSLTIPPNEDSIQVDFIFWEKDINSGNKIETPFSFKLKRYESTHLGMWGGK